MDCRLPGSSVHGISQARRLEWAAMSSFSSVINSPEILGKESNFLLNSDYGYGERLIILRHLMCLVTSESLWPHGPYHAGFPALYYLPEFAQTHVHWVDDAIQPRHLLISLLQWEEASSSMPCEDSWIEFNHLILMDLSFRVSFCLRKLIQVFHLGI